MMKWTAVIALMASMCMGMTAHGEDSLIVMTFNIRHGKGADGPNSWEYRKEILINAIKDSHPDILGLQECLDFQAAYIGEALPEYAWIGIGREKDGSGEMAAIYYKKDVFDLKDKGYFWMSETPDVQGSQSWHTACTRMATWVLLTVKASGKTLACFNTHIDHRSELAREESAKLLVQRIANIAGSLPVILTGDFNADAETVPKPWVTLTASGLEDAWKQAPVQKGPSYTFCEFKAPVADHKDGRIDWIMLRNGVKATECETITYNENGRYPSDHYPVRANVQF